MHRRHSECQRSAQSKHKKDLSYSPRHEITGWPPFPAEAQVPEQDSTPLITFEPVPVRARHDGTAAWRPRFAPFSAPSLRTLVKIGAQAVRGTAEHQSGAELTHAKHGQLRQLPSHALTCARVASLQSLRFAPARTCRCAALPTSGVLCAEAVAWHASLIRGRGGACHVFGS